MEELIASVVSLLILVPIIYFLPIGLTSKGKGIVILVAFIFANLGILASTSVPLWQTGLIILLLTILTVYILDKRFKNLIFMSGTTEEKYVDLPGDSTDEPVRESVPTIAEQPPTSGAPEELWEEDERQETSSKDVLEDSLELVDLSFRKNEPVEPELELMEIPVLEAMKEVAVTSETLDVLKEETTGSLNDKIEADGVEVAEVEIEDEIAFLSNRDEILEEMELNRDSSVTKVDKDEIEPLGYMSEIEQLLENDMLEEDLLEDEYHHDGPGEEFYSPATLSQIETLVDDLNSLEQEVEENKTSAVELEDVDEVPVLPLENFSDERDDSETKVDSEEEGYQDDDEALEVLVFEDSLEPIEEEFVAQPLLPEITELEGGEEPEEITLSPLEVVDELPGEASKEEIAEPVQGSEPEVSSNQTQRNVLQQQIFHTMISQLRLVRNQMNSNEYEELIIQHLHPNLLTQDYYTFVSLLIEHYIHVKEIGKLQGLLTNLEGKFINYPILDMEFQYLYQQYCENAR